MRRPRQAGGFDVGFAPEAFSETLPAGFVLEQTPEPSGRIRKGGRIELVLSAGPERYNVPNLVDKSLADATAELAKLNLVVGEITQEHDDEATESVISSDPAEGTQVRRDTPIQLVVSHGPEPVEVPSLIGRTVDEARDAMEDAELELETTEEFNDTVQAGRIVSQEPASGKIAKGSTVSAVVSKGPQTFEVPDVKGKSVKDATKQLEKAGFTVDVLGGRGRVLQQNPGPGTQHPKGGRVVLLASLYAADQSGAARRPARSGPARTRFPLGGQLACPSRSPRHARQKPTLNRSITAHVGFWRA